MKKGIHPKYYEKVKVTCSCGNVFYVSSTKPEIKTEICFKCHPFYTGKRKLIDTTKRIEKYKTRLLKSKKLQAKEK